MLPYGIGSENKKSAICVKQMTLCNTVNSACFESGTDTVCWYYSIVRRFRQQEWPVKDYFLILWQQTAEYIVQGNFQIVVEAAFEPRNHSRPFFLLHFGQHPVRIDGIHIVQR